MLGGNGDRFYWGRREPGAEGTVVVFAWMSSEEKHVRSYVSLYGSLGWNSLVCHADFLTLFFPEKAASLARSVLHELVKEVKTRKLPIVFSAFSGGPKGAMYKLFQVECDLVKECACGQIYDSSPVDFTSDLGTRFVLHPSVLRVSKPPRIVSWMAKMVASGLDSLFLQRFERQRVDYWQTLHSSAKMGPVLILCSENDELAPFNVIQSFVERLKEQGSDVNLIKWASSPHVGHYKHHPDDYKHAVSQLLAKATACYSKRVQELGRGISGTDNSSGRLNRAVASSYYPSSSFGELEIDVGSQLDEKEEDTTHLETSERASKLLSEVCSPKTVENWDIMTHLPLHKRVRLSSANRQRPLNTFKGVQRSRL